MIVLICKYTSKPGSIRYLVKERNFLSGPSHFVNVGKSQVCITFQRQISSEGTQLKQLFRFASNIDVVALISHIEDAVQIGLCSCRSCSVVMDSAIVHTTGDTTGGTVRSTIGATLLM